MWKEDKDIKSHGRSWLVVNTGDDSATYTCPVVENSSFVKTYQDQRKNYN